MEMFTNLCCKFQFKVKENELQVPDIDFLIFRIYCESGLSLKIEIIF